MSRVRTPTWSGGQSLFRMASSMQRAVAAKTGIGEAAADTLEGPWDDVAADVYGTLYFLKGDRMLEIIHQTSSTDRSGAIRLAARALERL